MYILIDFENVGLKGIEGYEYLKRSDTIGLFYSQQWEMKRIEAERQILNYGCDVFSRKLVQQHKNGIDHYMACELGQYFGSHRKKKVALIISKDKGFKAIADYWNMLGMGNEVYIAPTIKDGFLKMEELCGKRRYKQMIADINLKIILSQMKTETYHVCAVL